MITALFQALTGRPWTTTRSCTAEFGPPPAARYANDLAAYTDAELITHGHELLARLQREDQATTVHPTPARHTRTPAPVRTDARVITAVGGGWT